MGDFLQAVCDQKHGEIDRRLSQIDGHSAEVLRRLDDLSGKLQSLTVWATMGKLGAGTALGVCATLISRYILGG